MQSHTLSLNRVKPTPPPQAGPRDLESVSMIINLLAAAMIILSVGLIVIGKWVQKEMITKAVIAQAAALLCVIVAAFMLK